MKVLMTGNEAIPEGLMKQESIMLLPIPVPQVPKYWKT